MDYLRFLIAIIFSLIVHVLFFQVNIGDYDGSNQNEKKTNKMEVVLKRKSSAKTHKNKNIIKKSKNARTKSSELSDIKENIDKNTINSPNVDNLESKELSSKNSTNFREPSINFKKPEYPYISKVIGEEGSVVVEVTIGKKNNIISVNVLKSSGYRRLDKAVVKQIKNGKVKSARKNGKNITSKKKLGPFKFKLND